VLYTLHGVVTGQPVESYDVYVASADGSAMKLVYHSSKGPRAAWASSGDAIYIVTENGITLVAADGSGSLADLGGNESDSLLSPAEKGQMDLATSSIHEAVYQYVVGRELDYQGKFAQARAAYRTASDLFASLPWQCPLLGFSTGDVTRYSDAMAEIAGRAEDAVATEVCKAHLTHIGLLIPPYAKEHDGAYPPDLATLGAWALPKTWAFNAVIRVDRPEITTAMMKCPLGDTYTYTPPAPGTQPKAGDLLLTCSDHPDLRVTWENERGELAPKPLQGYSFLTGVESDPD
jgi:hypothetical protein